ncbi:peptidoglycan N-acetylglucosamine deacetylase a [Bacillus sp. OxB-1]|uniref:polysaccharide deacetylase family protein n=1 Tax=Bacillus sp. (strain OxB-1) TaxID=98228 RepID=UPI000581EDB8|nr:polysaccharide deacetylase family protein [Bacillus sp. OxB-1]BAQ11703.1 peptidoglycan N-acetylglucosamine deacetylase a [Bacillus sp. OxB-1]
MKKINRRRRSYWIDFTFSVTIITLTVAAIYLIFHTQKQEAAASSKKERQSAAPTIVESIDSNYPGIKIITETSNDRFAPYAIQYPQSLHTDFNEEVSTYINTAKDNYLVLMKENKKLGMDPDGELNVSFETMPHHSGSYSFVLVTNMFTGGKDGTSEIRSFHLNPETGESISLTNLLGGNQNRLEKLSHIVKEAISADASLENYIRTEAVEQYTKADWTHFENFAVTDDALVFYFKEDSFAARVAGPPVISLPIQKVNHLLVDRFQSISEEPSTPIGQETEKPLDGLTSPEVEGPDSGATENGDTVEQDGQTIKKIALTFDDGPDPKVTVQILDILQRHDAKATFFMLGSRVEYYPEIARQVAAAGHELGNHSWNHPDLTKMGAEKAKQEILRTSSMIEEVTGNKATVFRPPYGAVNSEVRNVSGLPVVLWDVDTLDWKHRDPELLLEKVKGSTKNGSIVLMHDIHQSTADGLEAVLSYLQSEGYVFVTVSELE